MLSNRLAVSFFRHLIAPKSTNRDDARREFILNYLLIGFATLSGTAFFGNLLTYPFRNVNEGESPVVTLAIFGVFLILILLSRRGMSQLSAKIFVGLLLLIGLYGILLWGVDLTSTVIVLVISIVMSGILVGSTSAAVVFILCTITLLSVSYLQVLGVYQPQVDWKSQPLRFADTIAHVVMLSLITIVSWLSNREIEKSLKRARASESALKRERDQLEIIVEERTRQLREAQLEKMAQMYRFVEIGKSASGLFHDLVNPLTLVSLNLNKLSKSHKAPGQNLEDTAVLLERALIGTKKLESFVQAARKQVQNQEVLALFSIVDEIEQSIQILQYRVKQLKITLDFHPKSDVTLYGNIIKFSQVMTNLISNAIDAYEGKKQLEKQVQIDVIRQRKDIVLTVTDFGQGIDPKHLPYIFEPLFSTKRVDRGIGMGLSIAKDIIEKDFKGTISVTSELHVGTTFKVTIPTQNLRS
jgi:C4-dicarboxylate-specific signal transduction histidine kinase